MTVAALVILLQALTQTSRVVIETPPYTNLVQDVDRVAQTNAGAAPGGTVTIFMSKDGGFT